MLVYLPPPSGGVRKHEGKRMDNVSKALPLLLICWPDDLVTNGFINNNLEKQFLKPGIDLIVTHMGTCTPSYTNTHLKTKEKAVKPEILSSV